MYRSCHWPEIERTVMIAHVRDVRMRVARRVGGLSIVLVLFVALVDQSPARAASRFASAAPTSTSKGTGLLIATAAIVLVLVCVGFAIFAWSRQKRAPTQCVAEREALELAERALHYWEGALAHLQEVRANAERSQPIGVGDVLASSPTDAPANITSDNSVTAEGESRAMLIEKAVNGHAMAIKQRDERQLDLIRCMATGVSGTP
jgi:hypothetical protein